MVSRAFIQEGAGRGKVRERYAAGFYNSSDFSNEASASE